MTKEVKRSARGSFAIPEETFQKLKLYASRTGKNFNDVLNTALEEFVTRNAELITFAERQETKFRAKMKAEQSEEVTHDE